MGKRIVYASSSLALATLELFVNLQDKSLLRAYVKTHIAIPEGLIDSLDEDARAAFRDDPDSFDSRTVGDRWLAEERSCVLRAPSRVILDEPNYLLNPAHPDFEEIQFDTSRFEVNGRLME
jgi:RES domain-containing protein